MLKEDDISLSTDIIIKNTNPSSKTFTELLFDFIDASNLTDVDVYKKAFLDRRLFSKIKSNSNYHPSFGTVTLLALALSLSTADYEKLLHSASYSLPLNCCKNIILKYCFDKKIYNIFEVNNLIYSITKRQIKDL